MKQPKEVYPSKEDLESGRQITLDYQEYKDYIKYLNSRIQHWREKANCFKDLYEYNNNY